MKNFLNDLEKENKRRTHEWFSGEFTQDEAVELVNIQHERLGQLYKKHNIIEVDGKLTKAQ